MCSPEADLQILYAKWEQNFTGYFQPLICQRFSWSSQEYLWKPDNIWTHFNATEAWLPPPFPECYFHSSVGIGREKNVAVAEGAKFKILPLSFQSYSPDAFVLSRVQLNLNTEGQILPLRFTLRQFFFSKLNSVLAWEIFLSPKLQQYYQNNFHICATGVRMANLESFTSNWSKGAVTPCKVCYVRLRK